MMPDDNSTNPCQASVPSETEYADNAKPSPSCEATGLGEVHNWTLGDSQGKLKAKGTAMCPKPYGVYTQPQRARALARKLRTVTIKP